MIPQQITTLKDFIGACVAFDRSSATIAERNDQIVNMFEDNTDEDVRYQIYSLSTPDSSEPFRSAMINIGFTDY